MDITWKKVLFLAGKKRKEKTFFVTFNIPKIVHNPKFFFPLVYLLKVKPPMNIFCFANIFSWPKYSSKFAKIWLRFWHISSQSHEEQKNILNRILFLFLFFHYSSVFLMCTLAVAAAPSSSTGTERLGTPRKLRDSKISRIQPYVHTDTLTAPAFNSYNNLQHNDNDANIKYYHANKFLEKNHGHKKFGYDKKKVASNHELFKWVNFAF